MNNIKDFFDKSKNSKLFFDVLCVLFIFLVAGIIFFAGMSIGFRKASFARSWGEHYRENFGFGRPRVPFMQGGGMMNNFPNTNGAVGKIIKLDLPDFIVQDKENTEKVISVLSDTQIRKGSGIISGKDLKVDDFVVVIGAPNEKGKIAAKLIRLLPVPEFVN
jgi:hypothetical protein